MATKTNRACAAGRAMPIAAASPRAAPMIGSVPRAMAMNSATTSAKWPSSGSMVDHFCNRHARGWHALCSGACHATTRSAPAPGCRTGRRTVRLRRRAGAPRQREPAGVAAAAGAGTLPPRGDAAQRRQHGRRQRHHAVCASSSAATRHRTASPSPARWRPRAAASTSAIPRAGVCSCSTWHGGAASPSACAARASCASRPVSPSMRTGWCTWSTPRRGGWSSTTPSACSSAPSTAPACGCGPPAWR